MVYFRNSILWLILSILVLKVSFASSSEIKKDRAGFICKAGVSLKILRKTNLLIKSDVHLRSNIIGHGNIVLNGDDSIAFYANMVKVENLVLKSEKPVCLQSSLEIVKSLQIHSGKLLLNSFLLILQSETEYDKQTIHHIVCNFGGNIIYKGEVEPLFSQILIHSKKINDSCDMNISQKEYFATIYQLNCYRESSYTDKYISPPIPPPKIFS